MVDESRRRSAALATLVASAAVFGMVLWRTSSHQAGSDRPPAQRGTQEKIPNVTHEDPVSSSYREYAQKPSAPTASARAAHPDPVASVSSTRQQIQGQQGDTAISLDEAIDETNGVGGAPPKTLRMAELLQRQCEVNLTPMLDQCLRVQELLQEMSRQNDSRGSVDRTEANLKAHILKILPDAEISILECRETLCAVQLGSAHGYLGILTEDEQKAVGVIDLSNYIVAYEAAPSGNRVTHTLRIFERR